MGTADHRLKRGTPTVDLAAAVTGIVDALIDAGVRGIDDPRDANPPCVLVRPPELEFEFKPGCLTATWELWCIVPDAGRHQALIAVSTLIDDTQAALGWKAVSARPSDTLLNDGTTAPMYVLTFHERIHP